MYTNKPNLIQTKLPLIPKKEAVELKEKRTLSASETPKTPPRAAWTGSERYGASHGNYQGEIIVLFLCENLLNKHISIQECVNRYAENLNFKKFIITNESIQTKKSETKKQPEEKYTEENIQKAFETSYSSRITRFNEKEFDPIYSSALNEILIYLKKNETKINSRENFYFNILLSSLSNRLNKIDESINYLKKAMAIYNNAYESSFIQDQWASTLDKSHLDNMCARKIQKYNSKLTRFVYKPISPEAQMTPEQAIAHKTYLGEEFLRFNEKSFFIEIFKSFRSSQESTQFTNAILSLTALDALEHRHFALYGLSNINLPTAGGFYNWKNKVYVQVWSDSPKTDVQSIVLHELMHKALDRVFNNSCAPYFKEDQDAIKAYHECIRQVLLNAIDAIFPLDELEKLEPLKTIYLNNDSATANIIFLHKWNKLMPLDQLVENCFGKTGIFAQPYSSRRCFNNAILSLPDGRKISGMGGKNTDDNLTALLLESLGRVFGGLYDMPQLHIEFITNLSERSLHPDFKDNKIVKPLTAYIEKYVLPEMQIYIDAHPRKNQIKENDTHYFRSLTPLLYFAPILFLLLLIYTQSNQSTINGLLKRD